VMAYSGHSLTFRYLTTARTPAGTEVGATTVYSTTHPFPCSLKRNCHRHGLRSPHQSGSNWNRDSKKGVLRKLASVPKQCSHTGKYLISSTRRSRLCLTFLLVSSTSILFLQGMLYINGVTKRRKGENKTTRKGPCKVQLIIS
jgi:hypothetical protein